MHTSYNGQILRLKSTKKKMCELHRICMLFDHAQDYAINQPKDIHCIQPQMFVVISCSDYISTGLEVVL